MKVILSRKGFDEKNAGNASPILPDKTLLSMPIPTSKKNDVDKYTDFSYKGVSYADIWCQLRSNKGKEDIEKKYCHLDPDLREGVRNSLSDDDWRPAFGQAGSWQGYLRNRKVGIGDLFIFFGWFRQTTGDLTQGTLHFAEDAPDLHVVYGYLQVGEMIFEPQKLKDEFPWHPHSLPGRANRILSDGKTPGNMLYIPSEKLSFDDSKPGSGVFQYDKKRVLTYSGGKYRSNWDDIEALYQENILRQMTDEHPEFGIQYNQNQWQELVLKENDTSTKWVMSLFD